MAWGAGYCHGGHVPLQKTKVWKYCSAGRGPSILNNFKGDMRKTAILQITCLGDGIKLYSTILMENVLWHHIICIFRFTFTYIMAYMQHQHSIWNKFLMQHLGFWSSSNRPKLSIESSRHRRSKNYWKVILNLKYKMEAFNFIPIGKQW